MRDKPVILVFSRYYLPGYRAGGPIRSISNMVDRLAEDFEFRIITLDRDLGDQSPYPGIVRNEWTRVGKACVLYQDSAEFGFRRVREVLRATPCDAIYLNSFFDPQFTQLVLAAIRLCRGQKIPVIIAPRGEFSKGALRIKKWKKSVFIMAAKLLKLYDSLVWQASSEHEEEDIRRALGVGPSSHERIDVKGCIVVASDLAEGEEAAWQAVECRDPSRLKVCFLSRISRKKNLDHALRILQRLQTPALFTIYGPIEDREYWDECKALIQLLPEHIEVKHEGELAHGEVVGALQSNDLFLFPTRGENFGHVIHEALRAGLPILISDQTPWRHLEHAGVGWDLPLSDVDAFATIIHEVALWSDDERTAHAIRAREFAARVGGDPSILRANRDLFRKALELVAATGVNRKERGVGNV